MRLLRLVACAASAWLGGLLAATAGEELKCAAQYTLEEQLILEWAALGGDPHAQYAVAQCAFPDNAGALSDVERLYALKWLIVATCDASESEALVERDRMTRRLKDSAKLSFRRFGGLTEEEKLNRREKRFVEFRDHRYDKLNERYEALQARVSEADRAQARAALADQFARLGAIGLIRLGELAACPNFGASKTFSAAVWSAAAEAWNESGAGAVYGHSAARDWSIAAESEKRMKALSARERRVAEAEKASLLKTQPASIARLEQQAALGRLDGLGAAAHAQEQGAPRRSLTTAVQYALEALGFLDFVNGPDNDYGPSTIEAARKAQAHYGGEPTRWLSHEESRRLICDAATKKDDPVSYYHVALMYAQGWGYPQDLPRARFAVDRARGILEARLAGADELPAWKQAAYPKFRGEIDAAQASVEAALAAIPAGLASAAVSEATLCR